MPSHLHESHLLLFRNQPTLAAELISEALHGAIPSYRHARIGSGELTDVQPAEYRADLVIELHEDGPVFGIVLELQLSVDERKRFVWPAYVASLRARLSCPVCLLVVTADEAVARWAGKCVQLGGLHHFAPYVLGPSGVPIRSWQCYRRWRTVAMLISNEPLRSRGLRSSRAQISTQTGRHCTLISSTIHWARRREKR
jgi:hypothetical protein